MILTFTILIILWLSLIAYAVLGGADFGGGIWDFFAFGPRAQQERRLIGQALGPVWEANHAWLIFLIVGLFTASPTAFAVLSTALIVPFTLALIGIVLRGAAFIFHVQADGAGALVKVWAACSALPASSRLSCSALRRRQWRAARCRCRRLCTDRSPGRLDHAFRPHYRGAGSHALRRARGCQSDDRGSEKQ